MIEQCRVEESSERQASDVGQSEIINQVQQYNVIGVLLTELRIFLSYKFSLQKGR